MCDESSGPPIVTFWDVKDPALGWRNALLGRYRCEAAARKAGLGAGSDNGDLQPESVTCVVLRGTAYAVTMRGGRGANYYKFSGRFCAEEWENWERGYIEPCVTSGGVVYKVDVMNGHSPIMECICPH